MDKQKKTTKKVLKHKNIKEPVKVTPTTRPTFYKCHISRMFVYKDDVPEEVSEMEKDYEEMPAGLMYDPHGSGDTTSTDSDDYQTSEATTSTTDSTEAKRRESGKRKYHKDPRTRRVKQRAAKRKKRSYTPPTAAVIASTSAAKKGQKAVCKIPTP